MDERINRQALVLHTGSVAMLIAGITTIAWAIASSICLWGCGGAYRIGLVATLVLLPIGHLAITRGLGLRQRGARASSAFVVAVPLALVSTYVTGWLRWALGFPQGSIAAAMLMGLVFTVFVWLCLYGLAVAPTSRRAADSRAW